MTRKELMLKFIAKLPDDVSYDRVIYHLGVMRAVEIGEEQIARGEVIDHDELFAELLGEDAESQDRLDRAGKARSTKHPKVHRTKRSSSRGGVRTKT
jgi:hypothetical protein